MGSYGSFNMESDEGNESYSVENSDEEDPADERNVAFAKRRAIHRVLQEEGLSSAGRNAKIKDIMSGKVTLSLKNERVQHHYERVHWPSSITVRR